MTTQPDTAAPELMDAVEVAALLGVRPKTVLMWALRGELPKPLKIGAKYVRWRRADIERLLDPTTGPTHEPDRQLMTTAE